MRIDFKDGNKYVHNSNANTKYSNSCITLETFRILFFLVENSFNQEDAQYDKLEHIGDGVEDN